MKTRINHQNDVICFRKICNKIGDCDCQKNIKKPIDDGSTVDATGAKKPYWDGRLITTVTTTKIGIFYTLRAAG